MKSPRILRGAFATQAIVDAGFIPPDWLTGIEVNTRSSNPLKGIGILDGKRLPDGQDWVFPVNGILMHAALTGKAGSALAWISANPYGRAIDAAQIGLNSTELRARVRDLRQVGVQIVAGSIKEDDDDAAPVSGKPGPDDARRRYRLLAPATRISSEDAGCYPHVIDYLLSKRVDALAFAAMVIEERHKTAVKNYTAEVSRVQAIVDARRGGSL